MCLLAIHFQTCPEAPLLIAANREEFYARPSMPPAVQEGLPRVVCGLDARAGGTWLGVNEHGLVVAVTNRPKPNPPAAPRSRGLLCRELLNFDNAAAAVAFAERELATGGYDGANFVCLDAAQGAVIHAGPRLEVVKLTPGLHLVTASDVNDPADPRQALARRLFVDQHWSTPEEFVQAAQHVCAHGSTKDGPGIVLRGEGRGTVSSTVLTVAARTDRSHYYFAAGPPDVTPYDDYSHLLAWHNQREEPRAGGAAVGTDATSIAVADDLIAAIHARTPARLVAGRAGPGYRTTTYLDLRRDHAAAMDAVVAEIDLARDFGVEFVDRWRLFEVRTRAGDKREFLMRPELGRRFDDASRGEIERSCPPGADLQIAVGDGLSAAAVIAQAPRLLPAIMAAADGCGLRVGRPFFIRHCRVGVLNDIGELLDPAVAVLLIGERPGLGTAESLSAYMAYRPRAGHTDADRNLISNIHARGVPVEIAAARIIGLAQAMRSLRRSGVEVKEERSGPGLLPSREIQQHL